MTRRQFVPPILLAAALWIGLAIGWYVHAPPKRPVVGVVGSAASYTPAYSLSASRFYVLPSPRRR